MLSFCVVASISIMLALLLYALALQPYFEARRLMQRRLSQGRQIVAAANAFRLSNGRWPDTIGDLVPKYLLELPAEGNWSYATIETGPPVLSADAGLGRRLMYGFPPRKTAIFPPGTDHGWIVESRDDESFVATD